MRSEGGKSSRATGGSAVQTSICKSITSRSIEISSLILGESTRTLLKIIDKCLSAVHHNLLPSNISMFRYHRQTILFHRQLN